MAPRIATDLHPSLIAYLKVFIVSCLVWQKIHQSPIKSYKVPKSSKIQVSFRCRFFPKSSTAQHNHPQVGVPGSLLGRQRHPEVDLALLMAILGIAVQLPRLPDDDVAMKNPTSRRIRRIRRIRSQGLTRWFFRSSDVKQSLC